jgi:branched-chain amino acid transport system ATP-binding protein
MSPENVMLKLNELSVAIQSVEILRGVSLNIEQGRMAGLIGRNGAGKTTLLRSVMGLLPSQRGTVNFAEVNLSATPAHQRNRLGIGYMPEDRRLVPQLSVEENILLPLWAVGAKDTPAKLKHAYTMIPEVEQFRDRKALQLSGGQQKLVALARALMSGTKLLLLDEPFEGVAPALAQRLVDVIAGLKRDGLTVLLSESDLQHSQPLLDHVFRIDRGVVTQSS